MRLIPLLLLSICADKFVISNTYSQCQKQIKIAVIDTGFRFKGKGAEAKLCGPTTYADFSGEHLTLENTPLDVDGHGTNIVGIIYDYAKKAHIDYCIVVIKYYSKNNSGQQNLDASIKSIKYASSLNVDYINYSGGGPTSNAEEKAAVKQFLDRGGKFVAAAGNDGKELGFWGIEYFPAMYDKRIIVVGNLAKDGVRSKMSNYGTLVTRWEVGEDIEAYGVKRTGTSQATAIATGKLLNNKQCSTRK